MAAIKNAAIEVWFRGRYLGDYEYSSRVEAEHAIAKKDKLRVLGVSYYLKSNDNFEETAL